MRLAALTVVLAAFARAQAVPHLPALLDEVRAHQRKTEQLRENYTFHHIETVDDLDAHGKVETTTTEESEVFFVNGHRIARLVKRNGKELTEAERKNEDRRVNKRVEEEMKKNPGPRQNAGSGTGSRTSQILAMAKISSPRRLTFHDRDTVVFDFTGDPAAHAHGMEENAAKKMSGTIWIDWADRQVARLEVRFDDNFRIGGGLLASVQKGTAFEMEQSPLGEGLWMQTSNEQHVGARLVVKNYRKNIHSRNVDFRKFDVGTLQQIKPPAR
jgi:hypothetical protein